MRTSLVFATGVLAAAWTMAAGCKDPTQVTLDVRLANAECAEIHGTAITVGVEPVDVESRFPTTVTKDCDPAKKQIGTLVVTPSDRERAAVVVVAAYGEQTDPAACRPPKYAGCIVARRRFGFPTHRPVVLPVTLDPDCVDVPCDAFSTCRKGKCFDAETNVDEPTNEPGALPDGGTDDTKVVVPEAGAGDASTTSEAGDGATTTDGGDGGTIIDAGGDATPPPGVSCVNGHVACPTECYSAGTMACCTALTADGDTVVCKPTGASTGQCPKLFNLGRWCCDESDCGPQGPCAAPDPNDPSAPRKCSGASQL